MSSDSKVKFLRSLLKRTGTPGAPRIKAEGFVKTLPASTVAALLQGLPEDELPFLIDLIPHHIAIAISVVSGVKPEEVAMWFLSNPMSVAASGLSVAMRGFVPVAEGEPPALVYNALPGPAEQALGLFSTTDSVHLLRALDWDIRASLLERRTLQWQALALADASVTVEEGTAWYAPIANALDVFEALLDVGDEFADKAISLVTGLDDAVRALPPAPTVAQLSLPKLEPTDIDLLNEPASHSLSALISELPSSSIPSVADDTQTSTPVIAPETIQLAKPTFSAPQPSAPSSPLPSKPPSAQHPLPDGASASKRRRHPRAPGPPLPDMVTEPTAPAAIPPASPPFVDEFLTEERPEPAKKESKAARRRRTRSPEAESRQAGVAAGGSRPVPSVHPIMANAATPSLSSPTFAAAALPSPRTVTPSPTPATPSVPPSPKPTHDVDSDPSTVPPARSTSKPRPTGSFPVAENGKVVKTPVPYDAIAACEEDGTGYCGWSDLNDLIIAQIKAWVNDVASKPSVSHYVLCPWQHDIRLKAFGEKDLRKLNIEDWNNWCALPFWVREAANIPYNGKAGCDWRMKMWIFIEAYKFYDLSDDLRKPFYAKFQELLEKRFPDRLASNRGIPLSEVSEWKTKTLAFIYNAVKRLGIAAAARKQDKIEQNSVSHARRSLFANRPSGTVESDLAYILGLIRQKQPYLLWAAEHGAYIEAAVEEHMKDWWADNVGSTKKQASQVRVVIQNQKRAKEYRALPKAVRDEYAERFKTGKRPAPELPDEKAAFLSYMLAMIGDVLKLLETHTDFHCVFLACGTGVMGTETAVTEVGIGKGGESFLGHTMAGMRSEAEYTLFTSRKTGVEVDEINIIDVTELHEDECDTEGADAAQVDADDVGNVQFVPINPGDGSPVFNVHVGLDLRRKKALLGRWIMASILHWNRKKPKWKTIASKFSEFFVPSGIPEGVTIRDPIKMGEPEINILVDHIARSLRGECEASKSFTFTNDSKGLRLPSLGLLNPDLRKIEQDEEKELIIIPPEGEYEDEEEGEEEGEQEDEQEEDEVVSSLRPRQPPKLVAAIRALDSLAPLDFEDGPWADGRTTKQDGGSVSDDEEDMYTADEEDITERPRGRKSYARRYIEPDDYEPDEDDVGPENDNDPINDNSSVGPPTSIEPSPQISSPGTVTPRTASGSKKSASVKRKLPPAFGDEIDELPLRITPPPLPDAPLPPQRKKLKPAATRLVSLKHPDAEIPVTAGYDHDKFGKYTKVARSNIAHAGFVNLCLSRSRAGSGLMPRGVDVVESLEELQLMVPPGYLDGPEVSFDFLPPDCLYPTAALTRTRILPLTSRLVSGIGILSSARIPVNSVAAWAGTLLSSLIDFIDAMHADQNPRNARLDVFPAYRVAVFLKTIPAYLKEQQFSAWEDVKGVVDDVVDGFLNSLAVIAMYRSLTYIGATTTMAITQGALRQGIESLAPEKADLIDAMGQIELAYTGLGFIWPSLRDPSDLGLLSKALDLPAGAKSVVSGLWMGGSFWEKSGGPRPRHPSYNTRVDLIGEPFCNFLSNCTTGDWVSWSTSDRCKVLTLIRVGFVQAISEHPRDDDAIVKYSGALRTFERNVKLQEDGHVVSSLKTLYPRPDWTIFASDAPEVLKASWSTVVSEAANSPAASSPDVVAVPVPIAQAGFTLEPEDAAGVLAPEADVADSTPEGLAGPSRKRPRDGDVVIPAKLSKQARFARDEDMDCSDDEDLPRRPVRAHNVPSKVPEYAAGGSQSAAGSKAKVKKGKGKAKLVGATDEAEGTTKPKVVKASSKGKPPAKGTAAKPKSLAEPEEPVDDVTPHVFRKTRSHRAGR